MLETIENATTRQQMLRLKEALWTDRSSFDTYWQEIANVFLPTRPRFTLSERNKGTRRNKNIIDNTATSALLTLQAGMHSGLTSPARPWMKLSTPDPSLSKRPDVAAWLHEVTLRMHQVFHLSNLYNALPQVYGDMALFGTAAVSVLEDYGSATHPGDLFRCKTYSPGSYAFTVDERGKPSTFVRQYVRTVEQVVEQFGGLEGKPSRKNSDIDWSRISRRVKDCWDRGNYYQEVQVCWVVRPNRDYDATADSFRSQFPIESVYFELSSQEDDDRLLRQSGFHEFPVLTPRWSASEDDTYGTLCPAMMALGDNNQLQFQQRKKGQAIEKMVFPAMSGPSQLMTQKVSLLPGEINYLDVREGMQGLRPVHEVKPDLAAFVMDMQEVQGRINRAFYVDLFRMLSMGVQGGTPPTAREIEERHEEKMTALGPVLEGTIDELLDPLTDRVFNMMDRAGLIPEIPEALQDVARVVEYTSILAQAQRMQQVGLLDRFMLSVGQMAAVDQGVMVHVDTGAAVKEYRDALGVHPDLVRSDEEVAAMQQAAAKAQQDQMQSEQLRNTAAATRDLSQSNMGDGTNALDRLAGRV